MLDRPLFSALIAARSSERLKLSSEKVKDVELRDFYRKLMESEAGHYTTFITLARRHAAGVDVDTRWKAFLAHEAQVVKEYGKRPEMHG